MAYAAARKFMVDGQLRPNKVSDPALLDAMGSLPRELFVPDASRARAYADEPVPLSPGRAMMAPMVLARLIQAAQPRLGESALVVGAGTGYSAAVLAAMGLVVTALEEDAALVAAAQAALAQSLPGARPRITQGKLPDGATGQAPYDIILFDGAVPEAPPVLVAQLAEAGRLVAVMSRQGQVSAATLGRKLDGHLFLTPIMDASAPALTSLLRTPGFVF